MKKRVKYGTSNGRNSTQTKWDLKSHTRMESLLDTMVIETTDLKAKLKKKIDRRWMEENNKCIEKKVNRMWS